MNIISSIWSFFFPSAYNKTISSDESKEIPLTELLQLFDDTLSQKRIICLKKVKVISSNDIDKSKHNEVAHLIANMVENQFFFVENLDLSHHHIGEEGYTSLRSAFLKISLKFPEKNFTLNLSYNNIEVLSEKEEEIISKNFKIILHTNFKWAS